MKYRRKMMKVAYECLPCLIRQATEASRMVTKDEKLQKDIIKYSIAEISKLDFTETAPYLGRIIHSYIKKVSGIDDPYEALKKEYNIISQKLCEDLELGRILKNSEDDFDTACRLAMAGNIIDFSVKILVEEEEVKETLDKCLEAEIHGASTGELKEAVKNAKKILYLCDNAGEIVFDKYLVGLIPKEKITCVVKGEPIVNDATMRDAEETGLCEMVRVIDNGADYQGTVLQECSENFKKEFEEADLIISKGQANYETLSDEKNKKMFFLLKAKCKSIAENLGCEQGSFVLKKIHIK